MKSNCTLQIEVRRRVSGGTEGQVGVEMGTQTNVVRADEIAVQDDVGHWVTLSKNSASFRVRPSIRVEILRIVRGETVWEVPFKIRDESAISGSDDGSM